MGLMPHASPTHVYASEYYKADFARFPERFGVPGIDFAAMLPSLWLPTYVRNVLGYRTGALVSMPVLNEHTPINRDFDTYQLMPSHNDMSSDARRARVRRRGAALLHAQRRRDPLPLRVGRRGRRRVAA